MAFYHITVTLSNGKLISAIRELKEEPIDKLYHQYEMKANGVYRDMADFNIALISQYSRLVRDFLAQKEIKPDLKLGRKKNLDRYNSKPDKTLGDRMNDHEN
jgi:hypothetical protein